MGLINIKLGWDGNNEMNTLNKVIYPCYALLVFIFVLLEIYRRTKTYRVETQSIRSVNESGMTYELMQKNLKYAEILKKIIKKRKK